MKLRTAFVLSVLCATPLAAQQATPPAAPAKPAAQRLAPRPAEDFAALPMVDSPKFSPDGTAIAAKLAINGEQYFAILSEGADKPNILSSGDLDINWWRWVNNDWLVVGIGNSVAMGGRDRWYVTRTVSVNRQAIFKSLTSDVNAQNADDVIWTQNDGGTHILLAAQHSIYSNDRDFWPSVTDIDVATGRRHLLIAPRGGVMTWIADGKGVVRMGIGHDETGRQTRILYRDTEKTLFHEILRSRSRDDDLVYPSVFLPEAGKALAYAQDDKGLASVFEYDLASLSLGKKLYGSNGYDLDGMILNKDQTAILGIRHLENRARIEWLDPDLQKLNAEFAAKVHGGQATLISYSDDLKQAIFLVAGADSPGAYMRYQRDSGDVSLLAYRNPAIGMHRLHPVRTIHYKARDGLDIAAVLTLPKGAGTHLPLIVLPHGGPFARDSEDWDWWAQFLADRGYAVVQPNYRGSSGYGTPFAEKGEGEWGLAMQDDLNDAVTFLAGQGIADPRRVCMVGGSYGGYAALRAAQRDGKLYRCAVSYAGVSDLDAMRRYDGHFLHGMASQDWLKKQAPDLKAVSPINFAQDFSIPVLVMHGKRDQVVPVDQSREMVEKLRAAGKDVTYVEQPKGDHHFSRSEDRLEFLKAMEAFLKKYNPA